MEFDLKVLTVPPIRHSKFRYVVPVFWGVAVGFERPTVMVRKGFSVDLLKFLPMIIGYIIEEPEGLLFGKFEIIVMMMRVGVNCAGIAVVVVVDSRDDWMLQRRGFQTCDSIPDILRLYDVRYKKCHCNNATDQHVEFWLILLLLLSSSSSSASKSFTIIIIIIAT
jgi:hypothetical protein